MEDREIVQLDKVREFAAILQQNLSSVASIKSAVQDAKDRKVPKVLLAAVKDANENNSVHWNKGPGGPYPWNKK